MLFVNAPKCFLSRREVDGEQSKKEALMEMFGLNITNY